MSELWGLRSSYSLLHDEMKSLAWSRFSNKFLFKHSSLNLELNDSNEYILLWPHFLRFFNSKFPEIKIDLKTGRSAAIAQELMQGQVDFSVMIEPVLNSNFGVIALYRDTFEFYRARKATLQSMGILPTGRALPIILMADALSTHGQILEESLASRGLSLEKRYVVSSLETAKEFAMNGLGIAVLPTQVARTHIVQGSLQRYPIKGISPIGEHSICAACERERLARPIYKALLTELENFLPTWLKR